MTVLRTAWKKFIDQQHRYPTGFVGGMVGERMVRQHVPETAWTISQLNLQPTDRVLEVGSGAGHALAHAAQQAYQGQVTGLDLSPTMLAAAARRNATAVRMDRVALVRGNLAALPFAAQGFDKIFSVHTLYFWPDPLDVLQSLIRVLAQRGTLVVTLSTGETLPTGKQQYWPVHTTVEMLAQDLQQHDGVSASLEHGPNSRQYNTIALVIYKH